MTIRQQGGVFGRHPKFDTVEANLIGIGTPDPQAELEIVSASPEIRLRDNAGVNSTAKITYIDSRLVIQSDDLNEMGSSTIEFQIDNVEVARFNSSGNLAFPSGNGIDFSATSGTGTSELFDDYEEGTWTPTISTTGTALTSVTYDPVTGGKYTKVGNLVHIQGIIRTDAITVGSGSGAIQIAGLPFTAASSDGSTVNGSSGITLQYSASFAGDVPTTAVVNAASTAATLYYRTSANGGSLTADVADLETGANANFFYFVGTYVAA